MDKINKQQDIAREVLHKLEATDPNCILAGGAPREWWFGKEANDLDFYVFWGENTTCSEDKLRLERLGFEGYRHMGRKPLQALYGSMKELRRVWEMDYKGETVQVMVMSQPTFSSVIERFGCSVSRIWWKGDNLHPTVDFLISHALEINFIRDDYNASEDYVKKMQERYPEYEQEGEWNFDQYKYQLLGTTKEPLWKLMNMGSKQSYENFIDFYKGES